MQSFPKLKIELSCRTLERMNEFVIVLAILVAAVCGGCGREEKPAAPLAPLDPGEPAQAQPKLRTMKLYLGSREMLAELALSSQEIRTGMMFRTNMDENGGMLFALPYNQRAQFWMKNCPYPLSAAYIDPEGVIQEIVKLEPFNTNSVIARSDNIRFVLETPRGWFEKNGIGPGVVVVTEKGPLYKTFFGVRP